MDETASQLRPETRDWNVIVSVEPRRFRVAREVLRDLGRVSRTPFYNILALKVADIPALLTTLREWQSLNPQILSCVSRIAPAIETFTFSTKEEFEEKARTSALKFAPQLAHKRFYVRIRRRGHKELLSSHDEERLVDNALLAALLAAGTPGRIAFEDPDAVIAIDTVGRQGGRSPISTMRNPLNLLLSAIAVTTWRQAAAAVLARAVVFFRRLSWR